MTEQQAQAIVNTINLIDSLRVNSKDYLNKEQYAANDALIGLLMSNGYCVQTEADNTAKFGWCYKLAVLTPD